MDLKALAEERAKLYEENKALLDSAKDGVLTPEQTEAFGKREARSKEIRAALERGALLDAEERALAESRGRRTDTVVAGAAAGEPTGEEQVMAFRGWCLGKRSTIAQREAALRCGVDIHQPYIDMAMRSRRRADGSEERTFLPVRADGEGNIEMRALSVGTTTAGGNSVPAEVMRAFYEVQKWYGNVRGVSLVVNTETGATLPWPTVTDTSNTGEILAEATTATTSADPTFGVVNVGAHKFSSKAVLVSWELLQDSFIDLSSYLGTALGRRIGRIQNTKFTVGAGTTEPEGIVVGSAAGATAGTTTGFELDDVITLIHSVDPAYRNLPGVGFMMHDTTAAVIRKMKDGEGRYLWEMSVQLGQPDRLFGYPVTINNDMSATYTTGQKLVLFGAFSLAFLVRDAGAVRFVRSEEKYILEHQVMFEASQRASSNIIDSTAIKHLKLG